ncbi:class I SAM-dependent methyltransferase [Castellaniella sp.]|uniref:class I SAM-dependent methyltransferase n=1 Tax=Castellaniella sp. TaxID=1955812 RepID=UPI002AFFB83A|nr:methyltransferase domain-containing protein [Castellaniella sp.]
MLKNRNTGAIPLVQNLRQYQARYQADIHRLAGLVQTVSPGLFLREWVARPGSVGAVWPSSRHLARQMAAQVPLSGDGLIVELGAGTGAVTQALLDRGIPARRLWIVERSPAFVQHLRYRFPALTVVGGDAVDLESLLPANKKVDTVVSSLPLRSLPDDVVGAVFDQWRRCLAVDGCLVQFTYALWGRNTDLFAGFAEAPCRYVWRNMPPARVRTFRRVPFASGGS